MRNPFSFEVEPFETYLEFGEQEEGQNRKPCRCGQQSKVNQTYSGDRELIEEMANFDTELIDFEWEGEVNRSSKDYIRWVQRSLNQILGLRLAVDGIMGPQTRSAIRSFQQKQGLAVDENVGPTTEAALIKATGGMVPGPVVTMPTDIIKPMAARLWKFDKNSAKLKDFHVPEIDRVADKIAANWKTGQPIFTVYVKGHTSSEGPPQYNMGLGNGRALAVRKALQKALERKQKNLSYKVLILALSRGAKDPIATNTTEEGRSQNRRVEVFLSTKALAPLPPKSPPPGSAYPALCASPNELVFAARTNDKAHTKFIELWSCGRPIGIEWFAVAPKADWLQVSPERGSAVKSRTNVMVTVLPGIAGKGKHTATVTFNGITSIGTIPQQSVTVKFYVDEPLPIYEPSAKPGPLCLGGGIFCETLSFMKDNGLDSLSLSEKDRQKAVQIEHSLLMKYCAHTRPIGGTPIPSGSDVTAPERLRWVQTMFRQAAERVDAVIQRSPKGPPIC